MPHTKAIAIVTDEADPSVGMFPYHWVIECPFYFEELEENREWFTSKLIEIYGEFAGGKVVVEYLSKPKH